MEEDVPLSSLAERIELKKLELNDFVATEILRLFKWSVGSTVIITIALVVIDTVALWHGIIKPDQRLVTEQVLTTLIKASVVQVGAASAAIVYGLFRQTRTGAASEAGEGGGGE